MRREGTKGMNNAKRQRSLHSMRMTKKHHYQYMGLWILLTVCLLIILNAIGFLLLEEHWKDMSEESGGLVQVDMASRLPFLIAMGVETVLFSVVITFLAKMTAHRIAGPYVRLERTFDEVKNGNLDLHLRFRGYDRLENVEQAFNGMMDSIRSRLKEKGPPQP